MKLYRFRFSVHIFITVNLLLQTTHHAANWYICYLVSHKKIFINFILVIPWSLAQAQRINQTENCSSLRSLNSILSQFSPNQLFFYAQICRGQSYTGGTVLYRYNIAPPAVLYRYNITGGQNYTGGSIIPLHRGNADIILSLSAPDDARRFTATFSATDVAGFILT